MLQVCDGLRSWVVERFNKKEMKKNIPEEVGAALWTSFCILAEEAEQDGKRGKEAVANDARNLTLGRKCLQFMPLLNCSIGHAMCNCFVGEGRGG